eukprot:gene8797-9531_t
MSKEDSGQLKVGINGFGRIGRLFLRVVCLKKSLNYQFRVAVINDPLLNIDSMAYLFKHDSVHGTFPCEVRSDGKDTLIIGDCHIKVTNFASAAEIPWKEFGVQLVAETSGKYVSADKAEDHLKGGAEQVVISAPAKDDTTPHFVLGVNEKNYHPGMKIVSNGSCTTNCLAPLVKVLNENFGIEEALMTTIHAVTASQSVVDGPNKKDLRAGRCYARNIIPAHTGAAESLTKVLPELKDKITGLALRVPVENVSVLDLTCKLSRGMNGLEEFAKIIVNIEKDTNHCLHDIIGVECGPVVSSDFNGDERSCIVDISASILLNPTFVKIISYYDNEWAYARRLADFICYIRCENLGHHQK